MRKSLKYKRISLLLVMIITFTCSVYSTVFAADCTSGSHKYSIDIIKEAGEHTDGLAKYTCTKCGDSYDEVIPKTGHKYGDWQTQSEPTCVRQGLLYRTCRGCGKKEYKNTSATGEHSYSKWKVISEYSCISDFHREKSCTVCGQTKTEKTLSGGHSYSAEKTEKSGGYETTTFVCSVCGHKRTEKYPIGQSPDTITQEAISQEEPEEKEKEKEKPSEYTMIPVKLELEKTQGINAVDIGLGASNTVLGAVYAFLIWRNFKVFKWAKGRRAEVLKKRGEYEGV